MEHQYIPKWWECTNSPQEKRSDTSTKNCQTCLFTVAELIRMAFSENAVNFKLVHVILLVLAKKLNIAHRAIAINVPCDRLTTSSEINLGEVKVWARSPEFITVGKLPIIEKETVYVVNIVNEESYKKKGAMKKTAYPQSLTLKSDYTKLLDKIKKIEFERISAISVGNSNLTEHSYANTSRMLMSNLSTRLSKTERSITSLDKSIHKLFKENEKHDKSTDFGNKRDKSTQVFMESTYSRKIRLLTRRIMLENADSVEETAAMVKDKTNLNKEVTGLIKEVTGFGEEKTILGKRVTFSAKDQVFLFDKNSPEREIYLVNYELDENLVPGNLMERTYINHTTLSNTTRKLERELMSTFLELLEKINDHQTKTRNSLIVLLKTLTNIRAAADTVHLIQERIIEYGIKQQKLDNFFSGLLLESEIFTNKMQYDIDTGLARFHFEVENIKTDEEAINEVCDLGRNMYEDLVNFEIGQKLLEVEICKYQKLMKYLVENIIRLDEVKCTREEFYEAMKDKAGLFDINLRVANTYFTARIKHVHKKIDHLNEFIQRMEIHWQTQIDDIYCKLESAVENYQLDSVHDNLWSELQRLQADIDNLLSIFIARPTEEFTKAITRVKCLSCGSRPEEAEFVPKRIEIGSGDDRRICFPMTPVREEERFAHPETCLPCVDFNKQPEKKDTKDALMSVLKSSVKKKSVHVLEKDLIKKELIKLPCKPCNKPKQAVNIDKKPEVPSPDSHD